MSTYHNHPALKAEERRNEFFLEMKCRQLKLDPKDLTIEEALELAIEADTFARQCGPFDIACGPLYENSRMYLSLAELLEKRQQYIHLIEPPQA